MLGGLSGRSWDERGDYIVRVNNRKVFGTV